MFTARLQMTWAILFVLSVLPLIFSRRQKKMKGLILRGEIKEGMQNAVQGRIPFMLDNTEHATMTESACGHLVPIGSHIECNAAHR